MVFQNDSSARREDGSRIRAPMTSSPGLPCAISSWDSVKQPTSAARLYGSEPSEPMWLKSPVRAMSVECRRAALVSSLSTPSTSTPCRDRAALISLSAEDTAAEELNGAWTVGLVVGGGVTGLTGLVGVVGDVVGGWLGEVGEGGEVGETGEVGAGGGGCDWLGEGCVGCGEELDVVGVRTVSGDGLELESALVAGAEEVAVLVGVAGESEVAVADVGVTCTTPGTASASEPGDSGAMRFGAPSRSCEPAPAGLPCRIPGATKANAAMAAVDRLPMAIGVGRSGLNGLRPRWRAL